MLTTFSPATPLEHRGIVIVPALPPPRPVAAYITLDEALPRGLIREVDEPAACRSSSSRTHSRGACCSTTGRSSSARNRTASST